MVKNPKIAPKQIILHNRFFNFIYELKLHPKLFLFPLLILAIYEIFAMRVYQMLKGYSLFYYNYFIIASALVSLIGSILSDKYSRRGILYINLVICIVLVILLYYQCELLVIYLSPLFFSTPVARAALIDNHEHISIKDLMCVAYISIFLPWGFYSFFSNTISNLLILFILFFTVMSAIFFNINKSHTSQRKINKKFLMLKKSKWIYFSIAFVLVEVVFFLIFGKLEHVEQSANVLDFMNLGLLIGAFLCIFLTGKHDELLFLSYIFYFILAFNTFLVYLFWDQDNLLKNFLGEIAIIGGVILPLVTEKAVVILGRAKRGTACGIIEFIASAASVIALIGVDIFTHGYKGIIITILILVIIACILQGLSNYYSRQHAKV